jgi:Protein-L-isoaspartate(D-aspartate) O-methyltransferase (PCMT)
MPAHAGARRQTAPAAAAPSTPRAPPARAAKAVAGSVSLLRTRARGSSAWTARAVPHTPDRSRGRAAWGEALAERVSRYILDGSDGDLRRLLRIAEMTGEMARRAFRRVGVREGWRVLECGCGPLGALAVLAEMVGASGRVVGVDFSEPAVQRARSVVATSTSSSGRCAVRRAGATSGYRRPSSSTLPCASRARRTARPRTRLFDHRRG